MSDEPQKQPSWLPSGQVTKTGVTADATKADNRPHEYLDGIEVDAEVTASSTQTPETRFPSDAAIHYDPELVPEPPPLSEDYDVASGPNKMEL